MAKLTVPIATDQAGQLIRPERAIRGESYLCPGCGEPVIFRSGPKVRQHFAHKASTTCSNESIIHSLAKRLIQKSVDDFIQGGSTPSIVRSCPVCKEKKVQPVPERIDGVALEHRLGTGHVADVALLSGGSVAAAVEIRVSHEIGESKAVTLDVPFLELDGYAVVQDPGRWVPLREALSPVRCRSCEQALMELGKRLREISRRTNVMLPDNYYRAAPMECWKCGKEILVFAWPHDELRGTQPKGKSVPRTIQRRYSRTAGCYYWANTCPYCKALIGDHYIYCEPDTAPFFIIDCEDEGDGSYVADMWRIAVYLKNPGLMHDTPADPARYSKWVRRALESAG